MSSTRPVIPTARHRQAHSAVVAPPRRLDASMTLLNEVMQRPLDPGYAAVAAAKQAGTFRKGPATALIILVIAGLCGGLVFTAVHALRRPQPEVVHARTALINEIERRTAQTDQVQRENESLRASMASAQQAALNNQGAGLAQRSRNLGVLTGEFAITGPGLLITLNDAPNVDQTGSTDPRNNTGSDSGRVLDRDLQIVVNGLWAAGAEAVSVNGQRLTALSAIRSAGAAILVDFRPLAPPYLVQAIGDPAGLQAGFANDMAGPYLQSLTSNYGIRAGIQAKHSLTLPGAAALALHYAHVAGGGGAAASASTPSASVTSEVSK
jgi:uncharacterized protein YlxW (UPF0749 family)